MTLCYYALWLGFNIKSTPPIVHLLTSAHLNENASTLRLCIGKVAPRSSLERHLADVIGLEMVSLKNSPPAPANYQRRADGGGAADGRRVMLKDTEKEAI